MSMADEIRKLAELRAAGEITEAEYQQAKARLLAADVGAGSAGGAGAGAGGAPRGAASPINRFRRSTSDRWIGGVCGGLAALTDTDSWVWRLLFTVALVFAGVGPLLYILLWIFVPSDDQP